MSGFDCGMPGQERRFQIRSVSDLNAAIDEVKGDDCKLDDITIAICMGVCPRPLFDPFTSEVWVLHNALKDGAPWPWPGGFYNQPAPFARARAVIEDELALIAAEDRRRNAQ